VGLDVGGVGQAGHDGNQDSEEYEKGQGKDQGSFHQLSRLETITLHSVVSSFGKVNWSV
jgi:hypothetical protein